MNWHLAFQIAASLIAVALAVFVAGLVQDPED